MRIAIVTSVYGGYDELKPILLQNGDVSYTAVCDKKQEPSAWNVLVRPRPHVHPRLAAKVAKCMPWYYTEADVYIWIDGSFRIKSPEFAQWAASFVKDSDMAAMPKPESLIEEAEVSLTQHTKYAGHPLLEQVRNYEEHGLYPKQIWMSGILVYKHNIRCMEFGASWLTEQLVWSWQDQISLAPMVLANGIRMTSMSGNQMNNDYYSVLHHAGELNGR